MKEATEFGIKYLRTMPNGKQVFVMHQNIWHDRKEAEQMVENLKGVVACPLLVEIWDPVEIEALNEEADRPESVCPAGCKGNCAEEPLPEPKQEEQQVEVPTDARIVRVTRDADGNINVTVNGKPVTDPEQKEKLAKEALLTDVSKFVDDWPWLRELEKRRDMGHFPTPFPWIANPIWLWDPSQAPYYGTVTDNKTGHVVRQRSSAEC